jgi:quinol monooxygenase YgiN
MRTILARFKIMPGKEAEAEAAMKSQAAPVEAEEPGALTYVFMRSRKEPSEITVFEIYKDDEAFEAHRTTAHMGIFRGYFGSIFDPPSVKIERLEQIAGVRR